MTDLEICKNTKMYDIERIAKKIGLKKNEIEKYGNYKAKIKKKANNAKGKLILVTSTNPTPYGEGKTTLSIGLCDLMNKCGYKTILSLREPSLGPVFGTKGGATGGGLSQVMPMDDINLHFTGDLHAITSANNLISAVIDNHIFQGNELGIDEVLFERCLDVNDRALRRIKLENRDESFNITAASEIMALFTLAKDLDDLKEKISNILVGRNKDKKDIYVKDLHCEGAVTALLKDAFKPNLVQTLYHNPAIIHGGPFANIAHGCSSVVATKLAMSLSDYTITEAGFGSDMGAVKFLDIKCEPNDIYPDLIIVNTSIRGLLYNGENTIEKGISNLEYHILNMQKFNDNVLVIINKFSDDKESDIEFVQNFCKERNVECLISNMYSKGENDSKDIAKTVVNYANRKNIKRFNVYKKDDSIKTKIEKYAKEIYYVKDLEYTKNAKEKLDNMKNKYKDYKICISKNQYSITDNPKVLGFPKDNKMTITDIKVNCGAKFITVLTGNVITMPGLSKKANYLNIDVVEDEIVGIF